MFTAKMNARLQKMFEEIREREKDIVKKHIINAACFGDAEFLQFTLKIKDVHEDTLITCIEKAAYYAQTEALRILLNNSQLFYFSPTEKHNMLYQWLIGNITKSKEGLAVGWSCGPDSGPWPSTNGEDYIAVLSLLNNTKL